LFDLRNVVHANGTYDLPFGKGRQWLNHGGVTNAILGGWTLGDIFTFQTGAPQVILGGNSTFNDYGDGGVILNGVTRSQLQSSVGVYSVGNAGYVNAINPSYITPGVGANASYLKPNTTAGTFGQIFYMYGPHQTFNDMSLTKRIAITERIRFVLQAEFLNAFNHPVFSFNTNVGANNLQNPNFGAAYNSNLPRNIELRANIEF
jgi:hypothetical protein